MSPRFNSYEGDEPSGSDAAYFLQLTYDHRPVWWRARWEDTGERFLPAGGLGVIADRRNGELQGRFTINGSGQLGVRAQVLRDRVDSALPDVKTRTAGLSYQGKPFAGRRSMSVRFSWDVNDIEADDRSRDQTFSNYMLEVKDTFGGGVSLAYTATFRDRSDDVRSSGSIESLDQAVTVGKAFTVPRRRVPLRVTVRGGLVFRHQWEHDGSTSKSPILDVSAAGSHHRLALHLAFLRQDFASLATNDLRYHTRRLSYAFTTGRHEISLQVDQTLRRPIGALRTDSRRVSLRYRTRFGPG